MFTIDTGFFFKETVELIRKIEQEYGITIERLHPELTPEQQAEKHGPELYRREPDQCCYMRKVLPLQKKLPELDALVTGLRRTPGREPQGREDPAIAGDARQAIVISKSIRWPRGARKRSGGTSSATSFITTRFTTRATRASAAGPIAARAP